MESHGTRIRSCELRELQRPYGGAPTARSVEVHGGVCGEGAAICAIHASDAAYEFRGTRISGCELEELQRPYDIHFDCQETRRGYHRIR